MYFNYAIKQLEMHPLFKKCTNDELKDDLMFQKLESVTDEGKNVTREKGSIYKTCYKRINLSFEEYENYKSTFLFKNLI